MDKLWIYCHNGRLTDIKRSIQEDWSPEEIISALCEVIYNHDLEIMEYLLQTVDPNLTDPDFHKGQTALYQAIQCRNRDMMRLLLNAKANPNVSDQKGVTPLTKAIDDRYLEGCEMLLEFGADVNLTHTYITPLYRASCIGNLEICQLLIRHGANPSISGDDSQVTPLNIASRHGHVAIMSELIQAGADLESRDAHGYTSLASATYGGRLESVRLLIRTGAEINALERSQFTPLHMASFLGNLEMCLVLLQAGADRTLRGGPARVTPIELARDNNYHKLAQMIESYVPHWENEKYVNLPLQHRQLISTIYTMQTTQIKCPLAILPDEMLSLIVNHLLFLKQSTVTSPQNDSDDDDSDDDSDDDDDDNDSDNDNDDNSDSDDGNDDNDDDTTTKVVEDLRDAYGIGMRIVEKAGIENHEPIVLG